MLGNVLKAGFGALVLGLTSVSHALPVTLTGDTINYVYDDQQAALAIFGTPTISGDMIRFLPGTFRAESLNGAGEDLIFAEFVFSSIYSQSGTELSLLGILEFGDYEITTGGSVGADVVLTVNNNNDLQEETVAAGSFDAIADSSGKQFWTASAELNPELAFETVANDISVSIGNTLTATTGVNGDVAWIQKKFVLAAVEANPFNPPLPPNEVPAPGILWLFAAGLGLLARSTLRGRKAQTVPTTTPIR